MRSFNTVIAIRITFVFFLLSFLLCNCTKLEDQEKYQNPEWLAGKLYTLIKENESLSVFASLLEYTGYDTVLDLTGSFTVFAPDNQAFESWLNEHPEYGDDITKMPYREAEAMVHYHIIQNRWSRKQLQSLDIFGWIDRDDPGNDKPRGYKRQTIFQNPDRKYWIKEQDGNIITIVDSTRSTDYLTVYSSSRKYMPLFFTEYFEINDLNTGDYDFYFNRSFDGNAIFISNAKTIQDEIPAENGFVYVVDQVIKPPLNAEEYMKLDHSGASTSDFLELIYELGPRFSYNENATIEQPEALAGGSYDSLFNLNYPQLTFNIHEELTGPSTSNPDYTVRYQNGLLVPTNQALKQLINDVVTANSGYPHWPEWSVVPNEVRRIIVNAHMSTNPIYRTNIQDGFLNGSNDKMTLDESAIRERYYGSNASILLLDASIVPRAFTSITGPVYLRPGYSTMLYAMEASKTIGYLKKAEKDFAFFVPSDESMALDSSLILNWIDKDQNRYNFTVFVRDDEIVRGVGTNELTKRILNQVALKQPARLARREFIENLSGNFLVFDNENQTVTGGLENTWGYNSSNFPIHLEPVLFEESTDNGTAFKFDGWFRTPTRSIWSVISDFSGFKKLIDDAGLSDPKYFRFNFLTEGEYYTIFIPTDEALANSGADTLSIPDLQQFIKSHFIKGERIWTDGSVPGGNYETLRVNEDAGDFGDRFSKLKLETGIDFIRILDSDNKLYYHIEEKPDSTNIMIAYTPVNSPGPHDYSITGVVHSIDTVLHKALESR
ncbi:MAG: hypothetical protein GY790_00430 [Bacteroidetes bacterium]|nr:hypothetical protein [Bacteroidota bacterium]